MNQVVLLYEKVPVLSSLCFQRSHKNQTREKITRKCSGKPAPDYFGALGQGNLIWCRYLHHTTIQNNCKNLQLSQNGSLQILTVVMKNRMPKPAIVYEAILQKR